MLTDKSLFVNLPELDERIQWVKPKLISEVAFAEWAIPGFAKAKPPPALHIAS